MKLYVANCTHQNQIVHYRLDFDVAGTRTLSDRFQMAKQQAIPSGRQVPLGGDLANIDQVQALIAQLSNYGAKGTVDLNRLTGIVPYLFSIDVPVKPDQIRRVAAHNSGLRTAEGKQRRLQAAIVMDRIVEDRVTHELAAKDITAPDSLGVDLEFEQLDDGNGTGRTEEGYRVRAAAGSPQPGGRRGRNRKAA